MDWGSFKRYKRGKAVRYVNKDGVDISRRAYDTHFSGMSYEKAAKEHRAGRMVLRDFAKLYKKRHPKAPKNLTLRDIERDRLKPGFIQRLQRGDIIPWFQLLEPEDRNDFAENYPDLIKSPKGE